MKQVKIYIIKMTSTEKQLNEKLAKSDLNNIGQNSKPQAVGISEEAPKIHAYQGGSENQGIELKRPMTIPSIKISGLSLVFLCPILFCIHFMVGELSQIPPIQFIFVTLFISFLINYVFLIRKYEITPFLAQKKDDDSLKIACLLTFIAIICMLNWGWNGSGAIIAGMVWEWLRGKKMSRFFFLYLMIVGGCLMMEKHFTILKLIELVPGLLLGIANSIIFKFKDESTYTITHQFIFFISICLPMAFPTAKIIVPNLHQWGLMIVAGVSVYFTVVCTVKLMQKERVSIVMAIFSGIFVLATSSYWGSTDFIGALLILIGIIFVVKKQFLDLDF